jgi:hypothetical protein
VGYCDILYPSIGILWALGQGGTPEILTSKVLIQFEIDDFWWPK